MSIRPYGTDYGTRVMLSECPRCGDQVRSSADVVGTARLCQPCRREVRIAQYDAKAISEGVAT